MTLITPKVSVVILNWNGLKHLQTFLKSVVEHSYEATIVLADNGSTDDSVAWVKSVFPTVEIVKLEANYGFCGGYNRALSQLEAEYFVLLNSDVEVTENWLMSLTSWMDNHPTTAAVQPLLLDYKNKTKFEYAGAAGGFIDKFGFPFCRGRIFQTIETNQNQYNEPTKVFWASGACMMVRASLFKKYGGLDEFLFAHMEEIDLCWRLQRAGYEIYCIPQSSVFHLGGGTLHKSNPRKTYLNFRNSLYVWHKNHPKLMPVGHLLIRLFLDGLAGLYFLCFGHYKDTLAVIKAHFAYYRSIPEIISIKKRDLNLYPKSVGLFPKSIVIAYYLFKQNTIKKLEL
jgi:GT2 family glycosyltransferase